MPPAGTSSARLAVLMPVYNAQRGLERSLASLRSDGSEFEVFIVDDGSVPPLVVPEGMPFPIRLVRAPCNQGITAALNVGLGQITTREFQYVARLDAGDLSFPGRFHAQMAFLDAHSDHAAVGTHVEVVDEDGHFIHLFSPPTDHRDVLRRFRYENALGHPGVMIRVEALRAVGFYSEDYPGGEDYELWLRLARSWKLANLDRVFVRKEKARFSITGRRFRPAFTRLRIQLDHFTPWSVHAYLGVLRSLFALLLSHDAVLRIRRLQGRWSAPLPRARDS
jgi:glycosyltransferase involved in cell wall biosynthesis